MMKSRNIQAQEFILISKTISDGKKMKIMKHFVSKLLIWHQNWVARIRQLLRRWSSFAR